MHRQAIILFRLTFNLFFVNLGLFIKYFKVSYFFMTSLIAPNVTPKLYKVLARSDDFVNGSYYGNVSLQSVINGLYSSSTDSADGEIKSFEHFKQLIVGKFLDIYPEAFSLLVSPVVDSHMFNSWKGHSNEEGRLIVSRNVLSKAVKSDLDETLGYYGNYFFKHHPDLEMFLPSPVLPATGLVDYVKTYRNVRMNDESVTFIYDVPFDECLDFINCNARNVGTNKWVEARIETLNSGHAHVGLVLEAAHHLDGPPKIVSKIKPSSKLFVSIIPQLHHVAKWLDSAGKVLVKRDEGFIKVKVVFYRFDVDGFYHWETRQTILDAVHTHNRFYSNNVDRFLDNQIWRLWV